METVEDLVQVVADNLRRLRVERGVSVSELARRSGVGRGPLTGLEAGRANPTIETLWALADALGAPFGDLVAPREGGSSAHAYSVSKRSILCSRL
jgi:transcriptional regulator with XRE-family HTH domain